MNTRINKLLNLFSIVLLVGCGNQSSSTTNSENGNTFDPKLAERLKADEVGMRMYTVCFLNPGAKQLLEKSKYDSLQQDHYRYMSQLASEGSLVLTGYFMPQEPHVSFLVFNADETDAKAIVANDPKVKAGLLIPEFLQWYSSAALIELSGIHQKISRRKIK